MVENLRTWFLGQKRVLPWREHRTPYAVWVSEVMLQQTQVSVVVPYFERWMARFPTIEVLAQASIEDVIKMWEGLGYYRRARFLHEGAREIAGRFGGSFPQSEEELKKIKGIGPYTAAAICSFAFKQKKGAIDGNVLRVATRYFGIEGDIAKSSTQREVRDRVESLLPDKKPWEVMEAMIELGALICQKQPQCEACPMRDSCAKRIDLPFSSKKTTYIDLKEAVFIFETPEKVLVRKREEKLMEGLFEFPWFSLAACQADLERMVKHFGFPFRRIKRGSMIKASFTRYRVDLFPIYCKVEEEAFCQGEWIEKRALQRLPFRAGHRQIAQNIG